MKSKWTLVVIVLLAIALHAYKAFHTSGVSGRISSLQPGETIWLIGGGDSIKATVEQAAFMLESTPGTYRLVVNGKHSFRKVLMDSVQIHPGKTTYLGEFK